MGLAAAEKTCPWGFANNTGADKPAHRPSLISAFTFVFPFRKVPYLKLATREISVFYLVSVAEETGLSLALSETPLEGPWKHPKPPQNTPNHLQTTPNHL